MNDVERFGRTAKFDYLTMVGKLGLAAIEPGSTYMQGATGPLKGARLLFGGRATSVAAYDASLRAIRGSVTFEIRDASTRRRSMQLAKEPRTLRTVPRLAKN